MAQPSLPAEGPYTEVEQSFIESSPPGLFPENQDSNIGQFRVVVTDVLQFLADQLEYLYNEGYPLTTDNYIELWEELAGVPIASTGKTLQTRRAIVANRFRYGPFTRTRRRDLVEGFIIPTFGSSPTLTAGGIPIDAGGVPLFSDVTDVTGTYFIEELIEDFTYRVAIQSDVNPDVDALRRDLARITPAGITEIVYNIVTDYDTEALDEATGLTFASSRALIGAGDRVRISSARLSDDNGWIIARIRFPWTPTSGEVTDATIFDWRTDTNNRLTLKYEESNNTFRMIQVVGGVTTEAVSSAQTWAVNDSLTIAGKWTPTLLGISINGGAFVTAARGTPVSPSGATADIGSLAGANQFAAEVAWAALGNLDVTNTEVAKAHGFADVDKTPGDFFLGVQMMWHGADGNYLRF